MTTNIPVFMILGDMLCVIALACGAFVYRPRSPAQWSFLICLGLFVIEGLFQIFSLSALSAEKMLFWQRMAMLPTACLPGVWLVFSLTFARGNDRLYLKRWAAVLGGSCIVPIIACSLWQDTVAAVAWTPLAGHWVFQFPQVGKLVHVAVLVGAVLMLTNLEWMYRASVGTARWKIKYAVIGFALIAGARIYSSSQAILYSATNVQMIVVNSLAVALGSVFLGLSLFRSKLTQIDIYPSSVALHKSFS